MVGVPKEVTPNERRVAQVTTTTTGREEGNGWLRVVRGPLSLVCCGCCQTPECVSRLVKAGMRVLVQKGAGEQATFSDQDYRDAGATVLDSRDGG